MKEGGTHIAVHCTSTKALPIPWAHSFSSCQTA